MVTPRIFPSKILKCNTAPWPDFHQDCGAASASLPAANNYHTHHEYIRKRAARASIKAAFFLIPSTNAAGKSEGRESNNDKVPNEHPSESYRDNPFRMETSLDKRVNFSKH